MIVFFRLIAMGAVCFLIACSTSREQIYTGEKNFDKSTAGHKSAVDGAVYMTALEKDLKSKTYGSGLSVERTGKDVTVIVPVSMMYNKKAGRQTKGFNKAMANIAGTLDFYNRTRVVVTGHTDSSGGAGMNRALSQRRAEMVAQGLVEHGVSPVRLKLVAAGENKPRSDNATSLGRAKNRRVEIQLLHVPS